MEISVPVFQLGGGEAQSASLYNDWYPYMWAGGAVLSGLLGTVGLEAMLNSHRFVGDDYGEAGYTHMEELGFVVSLFLMPLAVVCACVFVMTMFKHPYKGPVEKTLALATMNTTLLACAIVAYVQWRGGQLLACWFFCFEASIPVDDDYVVNYLYGVVIFMVGLSYVFVFAFPLARTFLRLLSSAEDPASKAEQTSLLAEDADQGSFHPRLSGETKSPPTWCHPGQQWGVVFAFALLYPFLFFCTSVLPSTFEDFTRLDLKSWEADCWHDSSYGAYLGDAVRIQYRGWCMVFWPDLIAYYGFFYAVVLAALVSRTSLKFRAVLHSRVAWLGGFTLGQMGMAMLIVGLYAYEFAYWMYIRGVFNSVRNHENNIWERLARTAGQLLNLTMGLLLLPVARNNIFTSLLGVGWDAMIIWHQIFGDVFLVGLAWHVLAFFAVAWKDDAGIFNYYLWDNNYDVDNWTITPQVWVSFVFAFTHGVLTMDWIRRKYFEVFYYAHHTFLALFISTLFHANSSWYYIIGGLALWFFDRLMRTSSAHADVVVQVCAGSPEGVTQLSYAVDTVMPWTSGAEPLRSTAGQFAFVNVPAISALEWHPFTISSAPEDEVTSHHIKSMGPDTFTGKLHKLATTMPNPTSLVVNVEGPFGSGVDVEGYEHVILVAGGIGVTPCHALFRSLCFANTAGTWPETLKSVHLVWVAKTTGMLETFSDTLMMAQGVSQMKMSLFVTGDTSTPTALPYQSGRPDLTAVVETVRGAGMGTLLFHCGPKTLEAKCKEVALDTEVDFHTETFLL